MIPCACREADEDTSFHAKDVKTFVGECRWLYYNHAALFDVAVQRT